MHIVDITLQNAQQQLIDESYIRPVLVDFWASWCAPCKSLMPILEKLANEYAGGFLLAKVNADELEMISSQFGVRSLPTVMLIKDGQPVDGFAGALPEPQVRELLEKYLPKPWERNISAAQLLMEANDFSAALPLLRQSYDDSKQDVSIALLLAECHLQLNRLDNAELILSSVKTLDQNAHYQQLLATITEKKQAGKTPQLLELEAAHRYSPNDLGIAYELARQYYRDKTFRPALETLLLILRKDKAFADGAAKNTFMEIVAALGKGDALAIEFQRKLFTLLY